MGLIAATWFDAGLVVFHAAVLLAIAAYFRGERRREATSPARPVGWVPVALSLTALFLPWTTLAQLVGDSYDLGTRLWLVPLAVLLGSALVAWFFVPLAQRLGGIDTPTYLELRFGAGARRGGAWAYGVARAGLAAALLAWSARQAAEGAGMPVPAWMVVLGVGGVATICAALGGRRGLAWIDAWQGAWLLAGVAIVFVAIASQAGGGANAVAETTRRLGRGPAFDPSYVAPDGWTMLIALPAYWLASVAFFGGDATAQQRWSTAGKTAEAQRGLFFGGIALAVVLGAIVYLGVGLLDFYQRHPEALRGRWIANVDSLTRRSLTDPATRRKPLVDPRTGEARSSLLDDAPPLDPTDGAPLLDWYRDEVDEATIDWLIAERRLLRPNNHEPYEDATELLDPATGRPQLERLALRRPTAGREILLHRRSSSELLGWFITTRLPWGLCAIAWCGLLAGAFSATATTVAAASSAKLAERAVAEAGVSGLGSATIRSIATGGVIIGLALLLLNGDTARGSLAPLAALALGPSTVALALGLGLRRGTAATTLLGMATCGFVAAAVALWGPATGTDGGAAAVHPLGALPLGVLAGLLVGGAAALATRARSRAELRGLTIGCGPLGVREAHSAAGTAGDYLISGASAPVTPPAGPTRWKE